MLGCVVVTSILLTSKVSISQVVPVWETGISNLARIYPHAIASTPDGGWVICGSTDSATPTGIEQAWLAKLSDEGVVEWQRRRSSAFGSTVFSITADHAGYLVSGKQA